MVKSKPNKRKKQRLVARAAELVKASKKRQKQSHEHLHQRSGKNEKTKADQSTSMMRRIFRPHFRTLLVGEGNFSFARSLIRIWEAEQVAQKMEAERRGECALKVAVDDLPGFNMVATGYDPKTELLEKYPDAKEIVAELKGKGASVLSAVDATALLDSKRVIRCLSELCSMQHFNLGIDDQFGFDRIVFNFPHLGCGVKDTEENSKQHREMLQKFFLSAYSVLSKEGQVLVTIKTGEPYDGWRVPSIALETGLFEVRCSIPFSPDFFPGYEHRRTVGAPSNELEANLDIKSRKASARTLVFVKKQESS